jgi:SAM-dependent methyltransferase
VDWLEAFTIRERNHRINDPFTEEKFGVLGAAIGLRPGTTILDLACGSGEMLCQWAHDHGITGIGVDLNDFFVDRARRRAAELGVTGAVTFTQGDATGYVAPAPVDIAACIGAEFIGGGVAGTLGLLERSLRPGGLLLLGTPFWRKDPPDRETVEGCWMSAKDDLLDLPGLVAQFGGMGFDPVEMVLADEDSWDRYQAKMWFATRTWLDANPDHEAAPEFRAELDRTPLQYVRYGRPYLGWGVFVLKRR